jgi:hypothetical protein
MLMLIDEERKKEKERKVTLYIYIYIYKKKREIWKQRTKFNLWVLLKEMNSNKEL